MSSSSGTEQYFGENNVDKEKPAGAGREHFSHRELRMSQKNRRKQKRRTRSCTEAGVRSRAETRDTDQEDRRAPDEEWDKGTELHANVEHSEIKGLEEAGGRGTVDESQNAFEGRSRSWPIVELPELCRLEL